jgi:hypothetical protein
MRLIILLIIIFVIIFIFYKYNYSQMTYVKSTIDDNYYRVRDLPDKLIAANMIAKIRQNILELVDYMYDNRETKYKEYKENIERLKNRAHLVVMSENNGRGKETSYSVNKGDELVICLRSKVNYDKFHDINIIEYVVLHEISHIASPLYEENHNNHGPIFKKIFAFIANVAVETGYYKKINFKEHPQEYCGITINESII